MPPSGSNEDVALPEATKPLRSRMDPAALAAAVQADGIPIARKWGPAWVLLLIIGVSALIWLIVWLVFTAR